MKGALKRVFSDKVEDENPINRSLLDVPIKQENVCYTQPSNKQKKTKYNPLTKQGIISRCAICDSKMHWAKDCQHKRIQAANIVEIDDKKEDNNEFEEVNIVLMTTENPEPLKQNELNAIIDTACTRTVAGQGWLQNYLKNLDDSLLNQVEITKSNKVFKFGDSHQVTSLSSVKMPAQIGQKNCFTNTETVDENIPLLLSKTSLKKANTVLNLSNDEIKMFNQKIQTENSFNGHYSILILPDPTFNFDKIEEVLIFEDNDTLESKQKK